MEITHMGLSENRVYIPNEIAIFHRDNDQQNHWVQWGLAYFQTHPYLFIGFHWIIEEFPSIHHFSYRLPRGSAAP